MTDNFDEPDDIPYMDPESNPWDSLLLDLAKQRSGMKKHIMGLENGLFKIQNRRSSKKPSSLASELTQARKKLLQIEEKILDVERDKILAEQSKKESEYLEWWRESKTDEKSSVKKEFDLFISHASPDKESLVRPLAEELVSIGVVVWYDEFELRLGDSLRESIDRGVGNSRYGLVVLSEAFFKRRWTAYELSSFNAIEMGSENMVLPLWHKVSKDEVLSFSPALADRIAIKSSDYSIPELARLIRDRIRSRR
ncbi:MAG: toll/interleukin-1 receptor domain-containing protein [Verrucomicrobia bacterium]|nr:toll/interleukin-1 receptor domain-containing protein [Verrucomicrobiota bacterium]